MNPPLCLRCAIIRWNTSAPAGINGIGTAANPNFSIRGWLPGSSIHPFFSWTGIVLCTISQNLSAPILTILSKKQRIGCGISPPIRDPSRGIELESNTMSPDTILVRQQPLQSLGRFSLALAEALNQSTSARDKLREAVLTAFSGECIQCGIRVGD